MEGWTCYLGFGGVVFKCPFFEVINGGARRKD